MRFLQRTYVKELLNELLLNSGQYALFYVLLQISKQQIYFFTSLSHITLLSALIFQTLLLVRFGNQALSRLLISLLAPLLYTLGEVFFYQRDLYTFLIQNTHAFFWIYSFIIGGIQSLSLTFTSRRRLVKILDVLVVFLNVSIFVFLYMLFDITMSNQELFAAGLVNKADFNAANTIFQIAEILPPLFADKTHIYITLGGLFLALSIAYGRYRLVTLKDDIQVLFGHMVGESLAESLVRRPALLRPKECRATVLFSDIRGFTSLAEKYPTATVFMMLNRYFTLWESTVMEHGGFIDKFIGDAVMVLFGVPQELKQHEEHAVQTAEAILQKLSALNQEFSAEGLPQITIGIGIHTGNLMAGPLGGANRFEYTVLGDAVNIAARLEALNKECQTNLLLSEDTYRALAAPEKFALIDKRKLRGKNEEIAFYTRNDTA